ncbi:MAG: hypothetical protein JWN27_2716 [Candidatus Eremiobacteraeota bacterium]|nr:hypothetical protein [Candidatus Eremiobacteraeota bacterium]
MGQGFDRRDDHRTAEGVNQEGGQERPEDPGREAEPQGAGHHRKAFTELGEPKERKVAERQPGEVEPAARAAQGGAQEGRAAPDLGASPTQADGP